MLRTDISLQPKGSISSVYYFGMSIMTGCRERGKHTSIASGSARSRRSRSSCSLGCCSSLRCSRGAGLSERCRGSHGQSRLSMSPSAMSIGARTTRPATPMGRGSRVRESDTSTGGGSGGSSDSGSGITGVLTRGARCCERDGKNREDGDEGRQHSGPKRFGSQGVEGKYEGCLLRVGCQRYVSTLVIL